MINMTKFWFDHLHLVVPDPEKMADFFVKAFGAEKVSVDKLPDGRIRAELNITGGRIIISTPQSNDTRSPDSPQKRYGTEHFGMKVDELESALQQCLGAGGKLVREVTQLRPGVRIAFFMAPDNVLVELLEMK
jgi:catechol 2,3-dioxygenase-like lactoylglutathione lyase family enzyme